MADGKIKGKQIEDTTVSLNKLSGNGQLILASASQIQITGTSIGDDDIVTRKELSSVGNLKVTDFNTGSSFSNIQNIIFRGQTVVTPNSGTATGVLAESGSEPNSVLVWIPAPIYEDYFNEGNAALTPEATTSRFIGKPNGAYEVGDWTSFDSVARAVLNEPSSGEVSYTVTDFAVFDETTTLDFIIYDGTGASLSTVSQIVGTNSTTLNGLTINVTSFSVDSDRFKASATFTATLSNINLIPDGGRFSVEIIHNNSTDGTYPFTQNDIFYDSDGNVSSANIGSVTIQETSPTLVWRSGISYYSDNSTFTFSVLTIDNINDRSYPTGVGTSWNNDSTSNQVRLTPLNFNMDISYGHSTDFDGWSSSYNVSGIDWIFSDAINTTNAYIPDVNTSNNLDTSIVTRTRANYYDWSQSSNFDSTAFLALIDTYAYTNTTLIDPVGDESKRLSFTDLTFNSGSWDSTAALGDDYLQVAFDKMFYPREDYSAYNPAINITNARDYSALGAGATQSFDVYTQVSTNSASTTVDLFSYKWYVSHFLLGAVSNTGTFTFTSNIVESDFEIENGNNANAGDDDVAILVGHDSGSAGAGTFPDKWIYVTGDYSGRTAPLTNDFTGGSKSISYTWGTVGNYSRVWIAIGIKTTKQARYISQISLAAGT